MGRRGGPAFRRVLGARGACLAVRWWRGAGPQGWPSRLQTQFQAFSRASSAPHPLPRPSPALESLGARLLGRGSAAGCPRLRLGAPIAAPNGLPPARPPPLRHPAGPMAPKAKASPRKAPKEKKEKKVKDPNAPKVRRGAALRPSRRPRRGVGARGSAQGPRMCAGLAPPDSGPRDHAPLTACSARCPPTCSSPRTNAPR